MCLRACVCVCVGKSAPVCVYVFAIKGRSRLLNPLNQPARARCSNFSLQATAVLNSPGCKRWMRAKTNPWGAVLSKERVAAARICGQQTPCWRLSCREERKERNRRAQRGYETSGKGFSECHESPAKAAPTVAVHPSKSCR